MNNIPRRCRIDLMTPAELAIRNAVLAVEDMPADVRLTEAVVLLGQAREKVADFIDTGDTNKLQEGSCTCGACPTCARRAKRQAKRAGIITIHENWCDLRHDGIECNCAYGERIQQ